MLAKVGRFLLRKTQDLVQLCPIARLSQPQSYFTGSRKMVFSFASGVFLKSDK